MHTEAPQSHLSRYRLTDRGTVEWLPSVRNPDERLSYTLKWYTARDPLFKQRGSCDGIVWGWNTGPAVGNRGAVVQKWTQGGLGVGLLGNLWPLFHKRVPGTKGLHIWRTKKIIENVTNNRKQLLLHVTRQQYSYIVIYNLLLRWWRFFW